MSKLFFKELAAFIIPPYNSSVLTGEEYTFHIKEPYRKLSQNVKSGDRRGHLVRASIYLDIPHANVVAQFE